MNANPSHQTSLNKDQKVLNKRTSLRIKIDVPINFIELKMLALQMRSELGLLEVFKESLFRKLVINDARNYCLDAFNFMAELNRYIFIYPFVKDLPHHGRRHS